MPIGIKVQKAGPGQKEISGRSGKSRIFNTAEQDRKNKEMKKRTSSDKRTGPKEPVSKKAKGGKPGMFRRSAQAAKSGTSGSYKIKSGDSLSQIAKARGTTVKKLMEMNPSIKNANMIRAGASIKVPPKTEVSKMTGSKRSPYRGMTSKEITSGTMRKSPSKTSAAKSGAKAGGAKSAKPSTMEQFRKNKAQSRKKAREEIPVAAKSGGMMKKYAYGGKVRGMGAAKKGGKFSRSC